MELQIYISRTFNRYSCDFYPVKAKSFVITHCYLFTINMLRVVSIDDFYGKCSVC